MTIFTSDLVNVDYSGPSCSGVTQLTRYSRFKCAAGTPKGVIISNVFAGFRDALLPNTINSAGVTNHEKYLATFLASNDLPLDVILVEMIPSRSAGGVLTGNLTTDPAPVDVDSWSITPPPHPPNFPHYGLAYNGNGLMVPKVPSLGALPPGYSGSVHPAEDPTRPTCLQAMTQFVQHFRYGSLGAYYDGLWRIGCASSAGADTMAWVAMNDDRAPYHFPNGVGQDAVDTSDFLHAFLTEPWQTDWRQWFAAFTLPGIAKKPSLGGSANYDQQAATVSETYQEMLDALSVCRFGQANEARFLKNERLPVHFFVTDWNANQHAPYTLDNSQQQAGAHDAFFGVLFFAIYGGKGKVRFVSSVAPDATNAADLSAAGIPLPIIADGAPILAERVSWTTSVYSQWSVLQIPHVTWKQMALDVRGRFDAEVAHMQGLRVQYDNQPDIEPDADECYCRFSLQFGAQDQMEKSIDGTKSFRTVALATASLLCPITHGDHDALVFSDRIIEKFKARTVGNIIYGSPTVENKRRQGDRWRLDVSIPLSIEDLG